MRISDWSSDVCSSDLIAALAGVARIDLRPLRRTAALVDVPTVDGMARWPLTIHVDETLYFKPDAGSLLISPGDETPSTPCEIGRASSRERGCQYVAISGGPGSLTQKNMNKDQNRVVS